MLDGFLAEKARWGGPKNTWKGKGTRLNPDFQTSLPRCQAVVIAEHMIPATSEVVAVVQQLKFLTCKIMI